MEKCAYKVLWYKYPAFEHPTIPVNSYGTSNSNLKFHRVILHDLHSSSQMNASSTELIRSQYWHKYWLVDIFTVIRPHDLPLLLDKVVSQNQKTCSCDPLAWWLACNIETPLICTCESVYAHNRHNITNMISKGRPKEYCIPKPGRRILTDTLNLAEQGLGFLHFYYYSTHNIGCQAHHSVSLSAPSSPPPFTRFHPNTYPGIQTLVL